MHPVTAAIYARVSKDDQHCGMQRTELGAFLDRMGWTPLEYIEKASGKAGGRRPEFERLMEDARQRKFDVVVVWKMDRFGRSFQHLIENVRALDSFGIRFIATTQNIDTDNKSPMGKFIMHIFGAMAEFERDMIIERVNSGLAEYQREYQAGKIGKSRHSKSGKNLAVGRPARVFRRDEATAMRQKGASLRQIAAALGVSFMTVNRELKRAANGVTKP